MPYISATAEIMYAPLDLRFVMTLEVAHHALPILGLPDLRRGPSELRIRAPL
jgi:hypothetical protein